MNKEISQEDIEKIYIKIKTEAEVSGYYLNQDEEFTRALLKGLLINESRYGYQSCPCRLSEGNIEKDRDIICPCDYRDADINDYGACYCGLYVSENIVNGKKKLASIPERRYLKEGIYADSKDNTYGIQGSSKAVPGENPEGTSPDRGPVTGQFSIASMNLPVWRCRVCGYLCARRKPPEICPICKVKSDRFERFL